MSLQLIFDFDGVFADSWDLFVTFKFDYEGKTKEQIWQQYCGFFLESKSSKKDDAGEVKQFKLQRLAEIVDIRSK
jgi:hypothetical protein